MFRKPGQIPLTRPAPLEEAPPVPALVESELGSLIGEDEPILWALMELFGLEKCLPGMDSWDSFSELSAEVSDDWEMGYEDYLESEMVAIEALLD